MQQATVRLFALVLLLALGLSAPANAQAPLPGSPEPSPRAESMLVPAAAKGWDVQYVDSRHNAYGMGQNSLAYDPSGRPHIAYGQDHLYHAWWNGSSWVIEVIDPAWNVGSYASIAIDTLGGVHIAYYDESNGDLRYATNAWGNWFTALIHGGTHKTGYETVIAVDSFRDPLIVYRDLTDHKILYTYYDSGIGTGVWSTPEVASGAASSPYSISMTLGPDNRPRITFCNPINMDSSSLWFSYLNASGAWVAAPLFTGDGQTIIGMHSSIVYDGQGKYQLVYSSFSLNNASLRYALSATLNGATWSTPVPFTDFHPINIALTADRSNGNLHLLLEELHTGTRSLNYYSRPAGENWQFSAELASIPDSSIDYGAGIAMAPTHHPGVSYFDAQTAELRFTSFNGSTWTSPPQKVDGFDWLGECPVVRLDGNGVPHVAYFDWSRRTIYWSRRLNGAWASPLEAVNAANRGKAACPGMILLPDGRPAVSYTTSDGKLLYSEYTCPPLGRCAFADPLQLDSSVDPTQVEMEVDALGRPHIVYMKSGRFFYLRKAGEPAAWQSPEDSGIAAMELTFSMAVDRYNNIHLAYNVLASYEILYYVSRAARNGSWGTPYPLTAEPTFCWRGLEIAAGPDGQPRVLFLQSDKNVFTIKLILATRQCSQIFCTWMNSEVEPALSPDASYHRPGLVVDAQGRAHATYQYQDLSTSGLKYAYQQGAGWSGYIVDGASQTGIDSALALSPSGMARIAYNSLGYHDLKFAWQFDRIFLPGVRK